LRQKESKQRNDVNPQIEIQIFFTIE